MARVAGAGGRRCPRGLAFRWLDSGCPGAWANALIPTGVDVAGGGAADGGDWRSTFRPDIPSPARIYDYLLGGKDNYPADREAAQELLAVVPDVRWLARCNRDFLGRAVRFLAAEAGLRQFIDLGTGLPAQGNVHEVAQRAVPGARVVCVDNDPVVLAHGRALLHGVAGTAIIDHDLRQPEAVLADPELTRLIDFSEPVAVLMVAVL